MPDKYDEAIEILLCAPDGEEISFEKAVSRAWGDPDDEPGGCLFQYAGNDDTFHRSRPYGEYCGCLTQIRSHTVAVAQTPALTDAIRSDTRIPTRPDLIKPEDLPVFAEWQRKIDAMGVR